MLWNLQLALARFWSLDLAKYQPEICLTDQLAELAPASLLTTLSIKYLLDYEIQVVLPHFDDLTISIARLKFAPFCLLDLSASLYQLGTLLSIKCVLVKRLANRPIQLAIVGRLIGVDYLSLALFRHYLLDTFHFFNDKHGWGRLSTFARWRDVLLDLDFFLARPWLLLMNNLNVNDVHNFVLWADPILREARRLINHGHRMVELTLAERLLRLIQVWLQHLDRCTQIVSCTLRRGANFFLLIGQDLHILGL